MRPSVSDLKLVLRRQLENASRAVNRGQTLEGVLISERGRARRGQKGRGIGDEDAIVDGGFKG